MYHGDEDSTALDEKTRVALRGVAMMGGLIAILGVLFAVGFWQTNQAVGEMGIAASVGGLLCIAWTTLKSPGRESVAIYAKGAGALVLVVGGIGCLFLGAGLFVYMLFAAPVALLVLVLLFGGDDRG